MSHLYGRGISTIITVEGASSLLRDAAPYRLDTHSLIAKVIQGSIRKYFIIYILIKDNKCFNCILYYIKVLTVYYIKDLTVYYIKVLTVYYIKVFR